MKTVLFSKFIGSKEMPEDSRIVILGCPLEQTSSFRGGTKFAPDSIRKASWTIETYSPYMKSDLEHISFTDLGNLELPQGDVFLALELIERAVGEIINNNRKFLIIGGEHLITYPVLKALRSMHENIKIVHFDAHCDLRDHYEGQKLSHATVVKRIKELGVTHIYQIGIRSGTKEEFHEACIIESPYELKEVINENDTLYLTFDIDVLDPSLVPGVTTPEPGGLFFQEIVPYFKVLSEMHVIGADVVELSPDYDTTFVSSICASKVVREIIMILSSNFFNGGGL